MNATPTPDGAPHTPEREFGPVQAAARTQGADAVPRQKAASPEVEEQCHPAADLLDHPDPCTAAQAATVENLLRCWVREHGLAAPVDGTLRIPLPASGTTLLVPVHYWSPTGWHRFGWPCLADAPQSARQADAVTVAALLSREPLVAHSATGSAPGSDSVPDTGSLMPPGPLPAPAPVLSSGSPPNSVPGHVVELVGSVADSVRRTATFIAERREHPAGGSDLFLSAEQALLLGHPMHPTAKSREGLSDAEARLYSPELRGSFPLHWLAVAPSVLAADSAWTERGTPLPAGRLTERLAGSGLPLPDGFTALPMHPWQAREIPHRPEAAALLDAGLLRVLGPHGEPWHPTSSVRTVHRSGAPAMLKLSLGLRITNSRRENLRKELHRGVEVHRLLCGGLGKQWRSAHPRFDVVRDPAWLAVDNQDGAPLAGLDVMIRHNPFTPAVDASCVAGLVSLGPRPMAAGQQVPALRSRLADIVTRLAVRTGRTCAAVTTEWFLRYLEQVVRPVLWLDSEAGVALEAHQQNTVVVLDAAGWPTGGRYRDNQGYYFRESRRAELDARLPGIGEYSDTFVPDEVADERFAYYLGINNVFGLIGAFGSQRLADEQLLLAAFRHFLSGVATGPDRMRTPLPAQLLDSPVLRCKANLLTRLHGLDELVGPVDGQSVYVTIANPLDSLHPLHA
ncbi:iron transporter [Streptomyces hygroscopicus]|uniref:IucA/IucC family protein n=1 Tax=Streptomyces hygroscopicus TaxID=1912 RepID=UPI00223F1ED3|nr:IucA/IucC family protein [Streptomyces hygroscopicus]MCW7945940.1 iron transporter [Streptomyces hygroscopicus]